MVMRTIGTIICVLISMGNAVASEHKVNLMQSAGGTFYIDATLASAIKASFLVDTGSSLLTLNQDTFDALARNTPMTKSGQSAARMANGKIVTVSRYRLDSIRIGHACEVGPVDVAVLPKGNNILGVNALMRAAPLTITADSITLAGCQ